MPAPTTTKRDEAGIMLIASQAMACQKSMIGAYHGAHRSTSSPSRRRSRAGVCRARRPCRRWRARDERDCTSYGDQRQHRVATPRDARLGTVRRARRRDGPLPPLVAADRARERGARAPRSPRARPAAPAGARAGHRRDGDPLGPGGARRDHGRLRAQLRRSSRASPSSGGRASVMRRRRARSCSPSAMWSSRRSRSPRSPRARSRAASSSSRSWRGSADAVSPKRGRSARRVLPRSPLPSGAARGELVGIIGVQGPASRFDARAPACRCARRCSSTQRPSRLALGWRDA